MIRDNGPQFVANPFKEFIRISRHEAPQNPPFSSSNGKIERWHKSLKRGVHTARNAAVAGRYPAGRYAAGRYAAFGGGLRRA
jgi:transposase InsO family protein